MSLYGCSCTHATAHTYKHSLPLHIDPVVTKISGDAHVLTGTQVPDLAALRFNQN